MKSIICKVSFSLIHLVVMAGIQILSHDGLKGGFGSSGIVDLDVDIQILSSASSASFQSNSVPEKSTMTI
jgi:hypothetical protein